MCWLKLALLVVESRSVYEVAKPPELLWRPNRRPSAWSHWSKWLELQIVINSRIMLRMLHSKTFWDFSPVKIEFPSYIWFKVWKRDSGLTYEGTGRCDGDDHLDCVEEYRHGEEDCHSCNYTSFYLMRTLPVDSFKRNYFPQTDIISSLGFSSSELQT